ncbi:MAG TPA: alpha/beta hydrolase [Nocardioidaceae bacterium]
MVTVVLLALGGLVALLVVAAWAFQRHLVYFPDPGPVPRAATVVPGARDVELRTADGLTLGAWLVPGREPARDVSVLVANGNGGDRSLRAPLARALADEGLTVLLFDYRGYGGNPGSPSEDGLALDVRAARSFLTEHRGEDRLLYLGESLGTAVVTELAAEHPPDAMLLRSPFPDLASLAQVHYPLVPGTVLRDRYPLAEHLRSVRVPVTVVLGDADSIVPPAQSRTVAEAAPRLRRLVEVPGADHNSAALLAGDALVEAVVDLADLVEQER